MYYIDTVNQVHFLIIAFFSLLIYVFSLCINMGKYRPDPSGTAFLVPLLMSVVSFLSIDYDISRSFIILAEPVLLSILLILTAVRLKDRHYLFISILPYICALIIIPLVSGFKTVPDHPAFWGVLILSYLTLSVSIVLLAVKRNERNRYIFSCAVLFASGGGISYAFGHLYGLVYISLAMKLTSFIIFFIYFYRNTYGLLVERLAQTEERILEIDKSLDREIRKRTFEIELSNRKLADIAKTDALTKSFNKTSILNIMEKLITADQDREFSILMFDIDNFKIINDTLGHVKGDSCLKKLAITAKNSIRDIDSLGRYGGDEFIIVIPDIGAVQAKMIAERFRKRVDESIDPHFTISIGIATYPHDAATVKELVTVADESLYMSKQNGRNMVSHKNHQ